MKLTRKIACKVLEIVDAGLVKGQGSPKAGLMCVEAAVCLALGLPHGDNPPCVGAAVRTFKISLNDCGWSSPEARAKGMRKIAVAQLGSNEIDQVKFVKRLAFYCTTKLLPPTLRLVAGMKGHSEAYIAALLDHAEKCEKATDENVAKAASDAAKAAAKVANYANYATNDVAKAASDAASYASDASYAASYANYASDASYAASYANYASDAVSYASYAASYANYASDAVSYASDASYAASYANYASDAVSYASDAAKAAKAAERDEMLAIAAYCCLQALIDCGSPGCKWLDLCEVGAH